MDKRVERVRVAHGHRQRLVGLMFSKRGQDLLVIPRCNDIHTFGMRYPLDVAFLDRRGQVLDVYRNVPSGCRIRSPAASATVERASQRLDRWYQVGSYVDQPILAALEERKRR